MSFPPQGVVTKAEVDADIAIHAALKTGVHGIVVARKAADQTLAQSSTTLQNITDMLFPIGANETWEFTILFVSNSGTTPDLKVFFTDPSGATHHAMILGQNAGGGTTIDWITDTARSVRGGASDIMIAMIRGIVVNGATAGHVQFQAAQNTSDASDTKILANSLIIARQI
jgi:hypothetical protein